MGETVTVTLDDGNASTIGSPSPPAPANKPLVELGACIGRYTVRSFLGRGGMGEVYAAHDPSLDRLVAVKVIRPGAASHEARVRFLREAQVLARLNHPNVVAVHDVGTVADSTFLAMELVEGPTLADWLAEKPRAFGEIVDVLLAAGRGLAAAHAADITHRDFKPSNVMLGEARVRVVDFGLARPTGSVEPALPSTNALDATVTASGGTVGTPAYMAPEQADAKWSPLSDQYSFGVAFREAVTGTRDAGGPMPAWLRPLLERATAADPAARFPSMDALLAQIAKGRHRRRRRIIGGFAVVGAAAIITAIAWPAQAADPCPPADARFAGIWDPTRREAVHAAFTKTGLPYAEKAFVQVAASLDKFRETWLAAQTGACRATRVEGRQSAALLDQQTSCLERQRVRVRELTQLWIDGPDAKLLERAHRAVNSLPANAECEGDELPLPSDSTVVAAISDVRARLDRVWALAVSGRMAEAYKAMPDIVAAADKTGWIVVRAEAAYMAGYLANSIRTGDAEQYLITANQLALDAHDDRIAAGAQVQLVSTLSTTHPDRALLAAQLAEATLARAGASARPGERSRLARYRGDAYYEMPGKAAEAKQAYQQAYDLAVEAFGAKSAEANACLMRLSGAYNLNGEAKEARRIAEQSLAGISAVLGEVHPVTVAVLNELGRASFGVGDYDTAVQYFERALPLAEVVEGKDSLGIATLSTTLGGTLLYQGKLDRSEQLLLHAVEIQERILGPDHTTVADTIGVLTNVYQMRGDYKRQADLSRRTLGIMTKAFGPDHRKTADSLEGLALALNALGELEPALAHMRRVVEIRKKTQGDHHRLTLSSIVQLGSMLGLRNRCPEAIPMMEQAATDHEQAGLDTSQPLEVLAECLLVMKQPQKALAPAQASLAACLETGAQNPECATKPWMIARILEALGKRKEAIASARDAERRFAANVAAGIGNQGNLDIVRAWLAKHR